MRATVGRYSPAIHLPVNPYITCRGAKYLRDAEDFTFGKYDIPGSSTDLKRLKNVFSITLSVAEGTDSALAAVVSCGNIKTSGINNRQQHGKADELSGIRAMHIVVESKCNNIQLGSCFTIEALYL